MDDKFKQTEDQYFLLKGQLAAGRISREQFEAALKDLTLQDAQGRYWMIGADTGNWYVHDGHAWVQSLPPSSKVENLPPPSGQRTNHPPVSLKSRSGSRAPLLVFVAALIVALLLLAVVVGKMFSPQETVVIAPYATATGVAQPGTPEASLAPTSIALASSNVSDVKVSVVEVGKPTEVDARDFAKLNSQLADKIAALNQAELKFIRDIRASATIYRAPGLAMSSTKAGALTDQDLKDMAGKAMDVAILSDQMGELAGKQDKGSENASQSADAFYAIARNALSLALDAQNVRQALDSGLIPGGQAISVIADYGAQLWNSGVTDGNSKGNPFSPQTGNAVAAEPLSPAAVKGVQSTVNQNNAAIWIAKSDTQNTRKVDVPAAQSPLANPFDPAVLNSLTTADGQSDGNKAQQVAAANLQVLGAKASGDDPSKSRQLQVPSSPVAVAGGDQLKAGNIPSFKSGPALVVSTNGSSDNNTFMQTFGLNGDQAPSDGGKTSVEDAPALVSLNISNIIITNVNRRAPGSGSFEADVNFSFTVNWSTTMKAPQFKLNCNSHTESVVSQASGSLTQSANGLLIIYPGTVTVYCYANSTNGQSLGSTSVNVLVGDVAQATTRAQQVETDSADLNNTLTAEAVGTTNAQQTLTAIANANLTQTAFAQGTVDALSTEVAGTATFEFKQTAAAFETKQAQPVVQPTPTATPTFTPKVVDQVFHPGDVMGVQTKVVLQRGRLYRFTFSGRVNLINPKQSVTANQLPEHVNGVAVPASGIVVLEGTGRVASIDCGSGEPDPQDPGGYNVVVEDLGPS